MGRSGGMEHSMGGLDSTPRGARSWPHGDDVRHPVQSTSDFLTIVKCVGLGMCNLCLKGSDCTVDLSQVANNVGSFR